MYSNNRNGGRATRGRGFGALLAIMLAMGLGLVAQPAEAAPFAYVTNSGANTVSVIDIPTNKVVATVPVGFFPSGVAVTPDGKHAYVANFQSNNVAVIDTVANSVVGTPIPVGNGPIGVAISPDGLHAYVPNFTDGTVSVIDTATNTVGPTLAVGPNPFAVAVTPDGQHVYVVNNVSPGTVTVIDTATNTVEAATLTVGGHPFPIAVTPDGKHAYVGNDDDDTVSVIDTATNTVEATTIPVGVVPFGIAFTPDGKHAYVANFASSDVSVIATATKSKVTEFPVGAGPIGIAVSPDGKHAYVANQSSNTVSVIDTATNTVVGTNIKVGSAPFGVGIIPPPPGLPFLAFSATQLQIAFGNAPNTDSFNVRSLVTLSSAAKNAINLNANAVTFQVGTFTATLPPGYLKKQSAGSFMFGGTINGVNLGVQIVQEATLRYRFNAGATGASLTGTKNPVYVTLTIGSNSGATSVTAAIQGHASPQ
ncbi:MAG TPA: YncE family protein [Methylocella sp.]|jgi:YVTN family beta-propeller protein